MNVESLHPRILTSKLVDVDYIFGGLLLYG